MPTGPASSVQTLKAKASKLEARHTLRPAVGTTRVLHTRDLHALQLAGERRKAVEQQRALAQRQDRLERDLRLARLSARHARTVNSLLAKQRVHAKRSLSTSRLSQSQLGSATHKATSTIASRMPGEQSMP
eukprot:2288813-Amphidinium_carterae.1